MKQRAALDETLRDAPAALNNLSLAYNPRTGTLDTRDNIGEAVNQLQSNPAALVCSFLGGAANATENCKKVTDALEAAAVGRLPEAGRHPRRAEYVDRTLGGLVEVTR